MRTLLFLFFFFTIPIAGSSQSVLFYLKRANKNVRYYYDQTLLREAIADCNKALAIEPKNIMGLEIRATAKERLEDYRGAILDYDRAILLDPKNSILYSSRGVCKRYIKDYKGALSDFNSAILIDPDNPDFYFFRGDAKIKLGQKNSGCLDLSKAGELGVSSAYELIKENCN